MRKNKAIQAEEKESINYTIKDLHITSIIPNIIDNFLVTIYDDHHTIVLPPLTTGMQFKIWSQSRGGVFSRDVLKHSLNHETGKYIIIKGDELHCIARIIDDEEKERFESLKLIDGKIKDKSYMILRKLNEGDKLTNSNKYIVEKDIENENDEDLEISVSQKTTHEDDVDEYHSGSISLFLE